MPRTESAVQLAAIYSAADAFFNPTVEDNYPKGAIFSFTLPLAEVNTDEQTSNLDH